MQLQRFYRVVRGSPSREKLTIFGVVGNICYPAHDLTPAQNENYITYCRLKVDV